MNVQLRELTTVSSHSFVSPASYWMPDLINGSAWLEHAPFGFWIVEALRPRMVVELGVHGGFSYSVFCQAVQRLHLSLDVLLCDRHQITTTITVKAVRIRKSPQKA